MSAKTADRPDTEPSWDTLVISLTQIRIWGII